ncbi:MAG: hypothetical protein IKR73_09900 [Oscillospiraceae bacterium]|nr:hypothetical protein [Oscillospiraceae bacterium]
MNDIIASQKFICRRKIFTVLVCILVSSLSLFSAAALAPTMAEALSNAGSMGMMVTAMLLPGIIITSTYTDRIAMYEIMAGYRPHQILLGKAMVYLPFTLIYLLAAALISLKTDMDQDTVIRLILYSMICIRATLCIVFLSPLFKQGSFAPAFSCMTLMAVSTEYEIARSPLSLLVFGQTALLGAEITEGYIIKVILTTIIACASYYIVGYVTLKKHFMLEPEPLA